MQVGTGASSPRDVRSICVLVPYPPATSPSQRFRIEQWMPALSHEGLRADLKPFADAKLMRILHAPHRAAAKTLALVAAFARRAITITGLRQYDVVVVHRAIALFGPALLERVVAARRPLVFDFDDAIFLTHTSVANRNFGWLKFSGKTAAICRLSTHVAVGNEYLASYARQHCERVTVVPSSVDTETYRPGPRRTDGPVVIGWIGSSTSQTHLELFAPLLREIARRRPVRIRVVSDRRPTLDGVPVDWRPWSLETELEDLRGFDVGIMPMPDDAWAEGKCAMKALLYMSVGLPVVCSAVGMNRQLIGHGRNGFLASSVDDWVRCLEALIDEPALRARLGEAARATVVAEYSMRDCARRFAGVVLSSIPDRHPLSGP